MDNYLIIDIGTSSLRAALLDETRKIRDMRVIKRTAPECFSAEAEWDTILKLIKELCDDKKNNSNNNNEDHMISLKAVSVSSLLGWVPVDSEGNAVSCCFSYMHKSPEIFNRIINNKETAKRYYRIGCRRPAPEQPAFKLAELKEKQPEVYDKTAAYLSLKDYINLRLTGRCCMDTTTAGYTMLYDVDKNCWSDELCNEFGVDIAKLPELVSPWKPVGQLRPEICSILGIKESCPVAASGPDGSCGILGAGGVEPGCFVSVMGTTDTSFLVTDKLPFDASGSLVVNPHVIPGKYIIGGPMGMYGGTLEWFTDHIMFRSADLGTLNKLAADVPEGSDGVMAFPTLAGERTPFWNAGLLGAFYGMKYEHNAGHLFRAMLEANAYATRRIKEIAEDAGVEINDVIASGGGSQSDLWLQIKADVMKLPVKRSEVKEATLEGAAILAQLASGKDISSICDDVADDGADGGGHIFSPDAAAGAAYDSAYKCYMRVHDKLAEL